MIKLRINDERDIKYLLPILQSQVKENGLYRGDYRFRLRKEEIIPQYFLNRIIFNHKEAFQQNNYYLGKEVRLYIKNLIIDENNLNCIGGESYLYGLNKEKVNFYTNNKIIYEDALFNLKLYRINFKLNLIDYNKDKIDFENYPLIINLSKLNTFLLKEINKSKIKKIIIISCHHNDFWKKINILCNYKLIKRKQLINQLYFLTVNLFHLKNLKYIDF